MFLLNVMVNHSLPLNSAAPEFQVKIVFVVFLLSLVNSNSSHTFFALKLIVAVASN